MNGTNDGDTAIVPVVPRMVELACADNDGVPESSEEAEEVEEWL